MQYSAHRNRIDFALKHLGEESKTDSPLFIFAHIIAPHPPFIFDAEGRPQEPDRPFMFADGSHFRRSGGTLEEYRTGYAGYLSWLNRRLLVSIDSIFARSQTPPVIVLQSDHGPGSMLDWSSKEDTNVWERTANLTAIYVPGHNCPELYPSITPVNIFRAVFNCVLRTDYARLVDKSFYSKWESPYKMIDVTPELDSIRGVLSANDN
jgi:hypothetical protein